MFGFGESQDAYNQAYTNDQPNESSFGHELIAGAAAFGGMKVFEDHQRKEGKVVSHQFAKEMLAGFAGAEVDKLAETKGMDEYDRERAKHRAKEQSEHLYNEHYERNQGASEYNPNQHGPPREIEQQFGGYGDNNQGGGYGGDQGGYGGNQGGYGGDQGGYGGNQGGYGDNQGYDQNQGRY